MSRLFVKISRYFHTIRHLKFLQIRYQLYYLLRRKLGWKAHLNTSLYPPPSLSIQLQSSIFTLPSYTEDNTFQFLNLSHTFSDAIDWNFSKYGKLWTYNLNYFEYLSQENCSRETGLDLINNFIQSASDIKEGFEPFPISLRTIFWIKFLVKHKIKEAKIDNFLFRQVKLLEQQLEYHLLGNHLLENGFALFFAAYYFQSEDLLKAAIGILKPQLKEQVLADGAHFECTPMYHQLMLFRVLDSVNLVESNPNFSALNTLPNFSEIATKMCAWLREIRFSNLDIPRLNDTASGIAPDPDQLLNYAQRLHIPEIKIALSESGYRFFKSSDYELLVDVGSISPSYIPGHTHADLLHFILHFQKMPIIVDRGISTYEKNSLRNSERSTSAHNTVQIEHYEQSDVWGGFRVGKRVKLNSLSERENELSIRCQFKAHTLVEHHRIFKHYSNKIVITDNLSHRASYAKAYFHFHPAVKIKLNNHSIRGSFGSVHFAHAKRVVKAKYSYAVGFNKLREATLVTVYFEQQLSTTINFQS